ncbi:hypothetical protein G9444_3467 [Rhodococcus erythropolis]|uniref:Uncharacterized protein n=1 Tax=Rhodococcus erythropolis TaxID=1833 RepID=A0A6G9CVS2_RHOER|nr:hypothetical protein G9444_3467 [Rhodococcus erythropolis]
MITGSFLFLLRHPRRQNASAVVNTAADPEVWGERAEGPLLLLRASGNAELDFDVERSKHLIVAVILRHVSSSRPAVAVTDRN